MGELKTRTQKVHLKNIRRAIFKNVDPNNDGTGLVTTLGRRTHLQPSTVEVMDC